MACTVTGFPPRLEMVQCLCMTLITILFMNGQVWRMRDPHVGRKDHKNVFVRTFGRASLGYCVVFSFRAKLRCFLETVSDTNHFLFPSTRSGGHSSKISFANFTSVKFRQRSLGRENSFAES